MVGRSAKVIVALSVGAVACGAIAGPLNKAKVDQGAKWLVHVDVEAVMKSTAGKFLSEHRAEMNLGPLEEFKARTGLDGFKDVYDLTVYGTTDSPDEAVAVIRGSAKLEAAVEALMKEDGEAERVEIGGRRAFKWKEDGVERFGCLQGKGEGERDFVVSREAGRLERALRVMEGQGATLAGVSEGAMAGNPGKGAMVYVVATELSQAAAHAPKVLRSAKEVKAELGEDERGFYGEMKLSAGAEEDVRNIADFGRGMLALGRMACSGDEEMKDLAQVIDGVTLEAKGTELTASFQIGRELLNAALAEMKTHHKGSGGAKIERTSQEKPR